MRRNRHWKKRKTNKAYAFAQTSVWTGYSRRSSKHFGKRRGYYAIQRVPIKTHPMSEMCFGLFIGINFEARNTSGRATVWRIDS